MSKEGGERGQEEKESGGGRRRRRRSNGQAHETRIGTSKEDGRMDWNNRVVEALDWNIRGGSGPGLERPGLHKEKEAAAARSACTRARNGGEGDQEEQESGSGRRRG